MENPNPPKPPETPPPADSRQLRQTREAEQKRNRDIGHLLKSGSYQQHAPRRSMPHVRGR